MPIVVPETDTFAATVSRPANGELADSASVLQYEGADASRDRWLYNRTRGQIFDVTRAPFSANASAAADARAAIQAALDAAASVGGHVFAPGSFRLDSTLQMYPGVSLFGIPDRTFLYINHATADLLTWGTSGTFGGFTELSGIHFGSMVANTGRAAYNSAGHPVNVKYSNCTWNSPSGLPLLGGRMLLCDSSSAFSYEDCRFNAIGDAGADVLRMNDASGMLDVRNCRFVMPATYSSVLVFLNDGQINLSGNDFDTTAHSGSADIININNNATHRLQGNQFRGSGFSSGACMRTSANPLIVETGSLFSSVNPYNLFGPLAFGSELSLGRPLASTFTTAGTITCSTGYRAQSWRCTNGFGGVGPTVALPAILFEGQRFTLTVFNDSAADWTAITLTGAFLTAPSLARGYARTFTLVALDADADGSLLWVLEHDPTSPYLVP